MGEKRGGLLQGRADKKKWSCHHIREVGLSERPEVTLGSSAITPQIRTEIIPGQRAENNLEKGIICVKNWDSGTKQKSSRSLLLNTI